MKKNWKIVLCGVVAAMFFMAGTDPHWRQLLHQRPTGGIGGSGYDMGDSLAGKYLSARFAAQHSATQQAAEYLSEAAKQDPDNLLLIEQSYKAKVMGGDIDGAMQDAARYKALSPKSFAASSLLAIGAIKQGDFVKAEAELKAVMDAANEQEKQVHSLLLPVIRAWVLVGQGRYPDARMVMESLPEKTVLRSFIIYEKALMADVAGQPQDAARYYDAVMDKDRQSYRLVQAASSFYLRIGRRERAETLVKQYNESHETLQITLSEAQPVANAREGVAEFLMETASLLYSRGMQESAMIYLHLTLYLRPDMAYAHYLLGMIQEAAGRFDAAITSFGAVPPGGAFHDEAQLATARTLEKADRRDEALRLLKQRLKEKPDDIQAVAMLGDMLLQEKQYEEAIPQYTKALALAGEQDAGRWPWLFTRGIAYERTGEWQKAEADFTKALELEPDHPEILNYLAYGWVVKGQNLEKARDMLERALSARPNEAHIVDSYGWVLYALGEYGEAVQYLEHAVELMSTDATVNDHLGDCYWRLGRHREARFQWERALLFKPEPEDEAAIRKKLEQGLPAKQ